MDGEKADFLSLILTESRFGLLGIVAPELGCKSWNAHDPRLLIAAIRQKNSSAATAIVQPASKVFQSIMMSPLLAYSEDAVATYHSQLNQALEVHESTMADIGPKMQNQLAINGIQPSHFAALTKERVSDSADWVLYWQVTHALEEQLKQSEVITRAALAATSAHGKYAEEFKKLHPSTATTTTITPSPPKVQTEKAA